MGTILQDIRYGLRMLLKRPGTSIVAILALAIGIGANTATFSLVDGLLFRPLAFNNLDRLVMVWNGTNAGNRLAATPADFLDWKREQQSFDKLVGYRWWSVNLTGADEPERVQGFQVSTDFFEALEVHPLAGRTFATDEAQAGRDRVAVINERLWTRRVAEDPGLVGRSILLNGQAYTVIGIISADYEWPMTADVWTPLVYSPEDQQDRRSLSTYAVGRLKPDVTRAQAEENMNLIAGRLAGQYPDTNRVGPSAWSVYPVKTAMILKNLFSCYCLVP